MQPQVALSLLPFTPLQHVVINATPNNVITRRVFLRFLSWGGLSSIFWTSSVSARTPDQEREAVASTAPNFDYYVASSDEPLPVELVDWQVQAEGEDAVLTWQTASEQNNAGFAVEHQGPDTEREGWVETGFVDGQGTTQTRTNYRYVEENLATGTHRFRLRQIDVDGSVTYTDPLSVRRGMRESVHLTAPAPNPIQAQGRFSFAVRDEEAVRIVMYDVLGRRVRTLYQGTPPPGERQIVELDVEDLAAGTYFIRLRADGDMKTRRCTVLSQ